MAPFRPATPGDLERIVALLATDPLGATREAVATPLPPDYERAFAAIDADPNHELIVLDLGEGADGVLQLSFIPGLTYTGGWRAQIEGVRIAERLRGQRWGERLFEHAIDRARERGCVLVQLTTDKTRPEALRFYERLGFRASHEGMKLRLR